MCCARAVDGRWRNVQGPEPRVPGTWHGSCIDVGMERIDTLNLWLVAGAAALLLAGNAAQATQARWQDLAEIRAAAAETVRSRWGVDGSRIDAVAGELDARVRLPKCEGSLAVSVPYEPRRRTNRVTTEVRCQGPRPWKIYVPVSLAVYQPVVIAARALPRDGLLTADDVSLAERDIARLDYGFLSTVEDVVGHRLRRPVAAGEALTPGNLEMPPLVRRGQRVTVQARSGGLVVRMAGVAQADGIRGQVIEVKNLNSRRTVQAVVRSAQSVEVLLQ